MDDVQDDEYGCSSVAVIWISWSGVGSRKRQEQVSKHKCHKRRKRKSDPGYCIIYRMASLSSKFTLALLFTSFAAIGLTGIVANWLVFEKFSQLAMEQAFESYQSDITAYIARYGSWEQAVQAEKFDQFQSHRQTLAGNNPGRTPSSIPDAVNSDDLKVPPPLKIEAGRPSLRFVLLDPQGVVLMGADTYPEGETAPSLLAQGKPITFNDQIVALAIPVGKPNLSDIDKGYLAAINVALGYALIAAATLALLLGVFFSRRLGQPLRALTAAIRSMRAGNIQQEVKVKSYDEIGKLLKTFNDMSKDLATAYEDLEKSNATIREQAEHLQQISIRDELTQLYNRRHFDEQAEIIFAHAKRHNHPVVLMIGDIDHFKQINDRFSHATGDEVLRKVAGIFQSNTRKNDLVARYGGEEFVIAFPETPLEQAVNLCERLREFISNHTWHEINPDLRVTMSMGLNSDLNLDNFEQMLAVADDKLYEAKNAGRNRVCY